jgi:hypothetical protein
VSSVASSEVWVVPGDPKELEFKTRDAALARAWELTPAGGKRREPMEVMAKSERKKWRVPAPKVPQVLSPEELDSVTHEVKMTAIHDDYDEIVTGSGDIIAIRRHPDVTVELSVSFVIPPGCAESYVRGIAKGKLELEAKARSLELVSDPTFDIVFDSLSSREGMKMEVTVRAVTTPGGSR